MIGYLESGFRDTFSKKPIKTMSDYKGIKIRTMQNQYHMAAFQSFGAMPTAMAYNEVFTALQQGTIDACENAVSNCLSSYKKRNLFTSCIYLCSSNDFR